MTAAEAGAGRVRLNPFAFPSDTGLRFALLVALFACASGRLWYSIASELFDVAPRLRDCVQGKVVLSELLLNPDGMQHAATRCMLPVLQASVVPCVAAGLALLAGATWLIYLAYPWWQVRRLRLERLDPAEAPELAEALDELCRIAKLRRKPEFWWNPLDGSNLALAFGTGRRRRVALAGAIALRLHTDPQAFRTVVLHELAHIRNGDVSLAYLALSTWWAFVATTLPPYAAAYLADPLIAHDFALAAAELGLLVFCVLLTRNAVLRARELYADARSFAWSGDTAGLARVLGGLSPVPRWRRLLSPHPAPSKRQRLVEDTDEMFRLGSWDAFGIGLFAGLCGQFLVFLTLSLAGPTTSVLPSDLTPLVMAFVVPMLAVLPMAAGAMAVGTWRAAFLALMRGRRRAPTLRTASACAAGGVVGWVLPVLMAVLIAAAMGETRADYVRLSSAGPRVIALAGAAFCAFLVFALALALAAFLAWVEVTARCWLAASLPGASPGPAFTLGLALCLLVAVPWVVVVPLAIGSVIFALQEGEQSGSLTVIWHVSAFARLFPFNLVAWFSVVALWAFPLSAALWSRRPTPASWAYLGAVPPGTPDLPAVPLRLRRAALLGVVGGAAAVLAADTLRLPLPATWLQGMEPSAADALLRLSSRLLTGMVAQSLIAVLTVLAVPRVAIPHAMCAAFVTGGLFAIGEALHLRASLNGRISLGDAVDIVLPFAVLGGVLASLVCASAACLLAAPVRRFLARAGRRRSDHAPYRSGVERAT